MADPLDDLFAQTHGNTDVLHSRYADPLDALFAQTHNATALPVVPTNPSSFKYTPPSPPPLPGPPPTTGRQMLSLVNGADSAIGFAKGAASTGYNIYKGLANTLQGQPADTIRDPKIEQALQRRTWGEQIGKLEENAAEFMAGEGALTAGAKAVTGAAKVPSLLAAAGRIAGGATSAAAVTKAQGGSDTDTAVAGAAGGLLGPILEGTAAGAKWLGLKFQARAVGLSGKDVAKGALRSSEAPMAMIDKLNTYSVARPTLGGTLDATQQKITSLANDLRTQLRASNAGSTIQPPAEGVAAGAFDASTHVAPRQALPGAGIGGGATVAETAAQRAAGSAAHRQAVVDAIKSGREIPEDVARQYPDLANAIHLSKIPGPKVDLLSAVDRAEAWLAANAPHMKPTEAQQARAAVAQYRTHYTSFEHGSVVPLDDAQNAKRAAGLAGAWDYGKPDADRGMERVSNLVYGFLKGDIENAAATAGVNVQAINKQLGDLIPLEQAMVRRVPVEARQQVLTLTDWMLVATGHPVEAAARVGGKLFGMGVGAGLVKAASGMRTATRPLTASVLDILNASRDEAQNQSYLAKTLRGSAAPDQQPRHQVPPPDGQRRYGELENEDMLTRTSPLAWLPDRFKSARDARVGSPFPPGAHNPSPTDPFRDTIGYEEGTAPPGASADAPRWRGRFGFNVQDSAGMPEHQMAEISKAAGSSAPETMVHELMHGAYEDLTDQERATIDRLHIATVRASDRIYANRGRISTTAVPLAERIAHEPEFHNAPHEWFSEVAAMYVANPSWLKESDPGVYGVLRKIFGREYIQAGAGR